MRSTRQWVSGIQASSPLRGPVLIRTGNGSFSFWKAATTARAEPVREKTANRCRSACCTPASGSSTTWPAPS